ncbi:F-box/LRR-repeat protein 4 [Anopheles darlingi]|uniref:F-box/LRR-repeat protein 4 n=1 Tax=Anopheles darlingi TaxID=43151 RepID=UPI0021002BB9|nr:F-box/LRR-repeat protein 4 [Anopheles darlingi]XP_049540105.1 F-box/LRR-repeat protein 4 [Anopheles darlingi]XP_049540115.1 F-box/LRR-repeat protein 4 [Anopheles darlingi]
MSKRSLRSWAPTYAMSANSDLYVHEATFHETEIEQYVTYVVQASDQYASTGSITYAAFNLVGRPNHFPNMGDFSDTFLMSRYGNWWQQMPSAIEEFGLENVPENLKPSDSYVLCCFDDKVFPLGLEVCETLSAGAIQKVWMRTAIDAETQNAVWALLWDRATDPAENIFSENSALPFTIKLRHLHKPGRILMVELNYRHLDYHAGIDSIMLKGGAKPPVYIPTNRSAPNIQMITKQQEGRNQTMHQNSSSTRIDQLPEELLYAVFQHLDLISLARAARVCNKFHRVARDSRLYFVLNLRPYWMMISWQFYQWATLRTSMCRKLNVSWNPDSDNQLTIQLMHLVQSCCRTLTHLHLSYNAAVNENLLNMVIQNCTQLQELSIDGCWAVNRLSLKNEQRTLTNLVRLNMTDNGWLDTSTLLQIVANNPNLKHLNINFCNSLVLPDLFELLGSKNRQLISLNAVKAGKLTSEALCCLATCTRLQEIDIGWTFQELNWQTEHLRSLLLACPGIRKLFLSATRDLQDNDLLTIAGTCSKLEQLSLVGCNNISAIGIQYVLEKCKNLKLLDISHCDGVENENVLAWQCIYTTVIKRIEPTQ